MKSLCFHLSILLTTFAVFARLSSTAQVQPNYGSKDFKKKVLRRGGHIDFLFSTFYNALARNQNQLTNIAIPYTVKDLSSGAETKMLYREGFNNPYANLAPGLDFSIRHGWARHFIDYGFGAQIYTGGGRNLNALNSFILYFGYGFNFFLRSPFHNYGGGWVNNNGRNYSPRLDMNTKNPGLIFFASIGFYESSLSVDLTSTIDNSNNEVAFDHFTAHSQFTYTTSTCKGSNATTTSHQASATDLNLSFYEEGMSIAPQFGISNDLGMKRHFWKLQVGWLIPAWFDATIKVRQNGTGPSAQDLGSITLYHRRWVHLFEDPSMFNHKINFNGLMFQFTLGIRMR